MTDTRSKTRDHDTDDTPSAQLRKASEGLQAAFSKPANGDTDGSKNDPPTGPAPATSYAGSGTTDPIDLNPVTHGRHYRGNSGDV